MLLAKYPPALSILAHCWRAIGRNYNEAFCFFSVLTTTHYTGPKIILPYKNILNINIILLYLDMFEILYMVIGCRAVGCRKDSKVLLQLHYLLHNILTQFLFTQNSIYVFFWSVNTSKTRIFPLLPRIPVKSHSGIPFTRFFVNTVFFGGNKKTRLCYLGTL